MHLMWNIIVQYYFSDECISDLFLIENIEFLAFHHSNNNILLFNNLFLLFGRSHVLHAINVLHSNNNILLFNNLFLLFGRSHVLHAIRLKRRDFFLIFGRHKSFFGATDTSVLDFW